MLFTSIFLVCVTPATAQQVVAVSNLTFSQAVQGDGPKIIAPGKSENASNGSFTITGTANRVINIILPTNPITMSTSAPNPGPTNQILIRNFVSFPAFQGTIGSRGTLRLFIGATRDSILQNQKPGIYSGNYTVDIVY